MNKYFASFTDATYRIEIDIGDTLEPGAVLSLIDSDTGEVYCTAELLELTPRLGMDGQWNTKMKLLNQGEQHV